MKNTALIFFLIVMGFYTSFGDPSNDYWSGFYFMSLHLCLLLFLLDFKQKYIRNLGVALQISILIYVFCKFFLNINYERIYNIIPFTITSLILLIGSTKIKTWQQL